MKRFLLYCSAIILFLILLIPFLAVSLSPINIDNSAKQVGNAHLINPLLTQTRDMLIERFDAHELIVQQEQANSFAGFLTRSHRPLAANIDFHDDELNISFSYQLNGQFYLNLSMWVESANGIQFKGIKIGQLYLPANTGLNLAQYIVDAYTGSNIAKQTIASIDSVDIKSDALKVSLFPLDNALKELKNIDRGRDDEKRSKILKIVHYLKLLATLPSDTQRSLNEYIYTAFHEANIRSNNNPDLAVEENQAAILALAIFAGDSRFSAVVGGIHEELSSIPTAALKPALRGRTDLSAHFVFSAAIKLLSEKDFSFAVGEFKELMDRGPGGSGYSFADLAADMAGVHFAYLASEPKAALALQENLIQLNDESAFMPTIDGLKEGLSKKVFVKQFDRVDSPPYRAKIAEIRSRVDALPINY
ncbi:MAG: hypothetical protein AAGJ37_16290 [Pseudomonadota bacterium]